MIWLLFIIFPLFFIIGLVTFVSWFVSFFRTENKSDRKSLIRRILPELIAIIVRSPGKKVAELVKDYQNELNSSGEVSKVIFEDEEIDVAFSEKIQKPKATINQDLDKVFSNWYSKNSINLLLYIGAFLIVSSASIFIGFQWETISGNLKAIFLTFITLGFFGFGLWFHTLPKIKNAGSTFTAIGALLIPLTGLAWYNFVLKDLGISLGMAWFFTSFVALVVYILLAVYFKSVFYGYISSFGALSLVLSLVNSYGLNKEFYILGSVIYSFVLLIGRILITNTTEENKKLFHDPMEISANVVLPVTLFYGFTVAIQENMLFSLESTLSVFLVSAYYFVSYSLTRRNLYLAISELLFPGAIIFLFNWQAVENIYLLYTLNILAFLDLILAKFMYSKNLKQNGDISLTIGIIISVSAFVFGLINTLSPLSITILGLLTAILGLSAAYIKQNIKLVGITSLFFAVSLFQFVENYLHLSNSQLILVFSYLLIGFGIYLLTVKFKDKPSFLETLGLSSFLYFSLSFFFAFDNSLYLLIVALVSAIILTAASFNFDKADFVYGASILFYIALFNFLKYISIDWSYYPFCFIALAFVHYGASIISFDNKGVQERFKFSSFVGATISPVFFGLSSLGAHSLIERNSLITAYLTVGLLSIELLRNNSSTLAYFTSAVGVITGLWQINYLGVSESQAYTIPLGIYFLILAYTRKIRGDDQGRDTLDLAGVGVLIVSSLWQSFGGDGAKYALLLGIEGVILIGAGISLNRKIYNYAGIFAITMAVLSQTYEYVFSLPRWLVTGIAGLIFLIVAIYLLTKRKENSP